jgi:hypothetical protein
MKEDMMEYVLIYTDEQFEKYLKRLNALGNPYSNWSYIQARKVHVDELGDQILNGEIYFKRSYGVAYNDVFKLSRRSMDKVLFLLFNGNFYLQTIADQFIMKEFEKLSVAINKLPRFDK